MMKTIPRDTLLETEEVQELLKGRIKLEKLVQEHGLTGLARGYWSNALIWALDRACGILPSERGQGASEKQEVSHGEIFDKEGSNQSWRVLGPATTTELRRSRGKPRNGGSRVFPLGKGTRSVESQLERLDRKASEEVQSQVVGSGG
jgi:hypothetical protein